jgi:hypothetical protein
MTKIIVFVTNIFFLSIDMSKLIVVYAFRFNIVLELRRL